MGEKSPQIMVTKAARPYNNSFNIKTVIKKRIFQFMETIFFDLDKTQTLMHGTAWSTKLCYVAIIACQKK